MRTLRLILSLLAFCFAPSLSWADNLLPPTLPVEQAVDQYLDIPLKEAGITPTGPADDANFIRRVTLDLVGRIPTLEETQAFTASTNPNKRVELVERLMNSPAFVRHQATEFDTMLMNGTRGSVRPYLLTALAENRSWDRIYRDLMLPDEKRPQAETGRPSSCASASAISTNSRPKSARFSSASTSAAPAVTIIRWWPTGSRIISSA